jgi:hypothetical protein
MLVTHKLLVNMKAKRRKEAMKHERVYKEQKEELIISSLLRPTCWVVMWN